MRIMTARGMAEVRLPAHVAQLVPEMAPELEKLGRLEERMRQSIDELTKLRSDKERTELEHGEAVAAAVLAEKPLPKGDPVKPIAEKIEQTEARIEALKIGIARQEKIAIDALEQNRERLVAAREQRRDESADALRTVLETYEQARATFMALREDVAWLRGFPYEKQSWSAQHDSVLFDRPPANKLLTFEDLMAALEKDADPQGRQRPARLEMQAPVPRRVRAGLGYGKPRSKMTPEEAEASRAYEAGEIDAEDLPESLRQAPSRSSWVGT